MIKEQLKVDMVLTQQCTLSRGLTCGRPGLTLRLTDTANSVSGVSKEASTSAELSSQCVSSREHQAAGESGNQHTHIKLLPCSTNIPQSVRLVKSNKGGFRYL